MDSTKPKVDTELKEICLHALKQTVQQYIKAETHWDEEYREFKKKEYAREFWEKMKFCYPYLKM